MISEELEAAGTLSEFVRVGCISGATRRSGGPAAFAAVRRANAMMSIPPAKRQY
jgi:hypothetical protein